MSNPSATATEDYGFRLSMQPWLLIRTWPEPVTVSRVAFGVKGLPSSISSTGPQLPSLSRPCIYNVWVEPIAQFRSEMDRVAVTPSRGLSKIPVIGLSSSDCDFSLVQHPIPANDTSVRSIRLICQPIAESYVKGKTEARPGAKAPDGENAKTEASA